MGVGKTGILQGQGDASGPESLKNGFTTGTAAAAAAVSALNAGNDQFSDQVQVPLPPHFDNFLTIPIAKQGKLPGGGFAEVIKDGGDDPDVTHGMTIRVEIYKTSRNYLEFAAGPGVGTVTLPGLPVQPGLPAINPVPRCQIARALGNRPGLLVRISAPEGEERARKTLNGKLGIKGGISILGTRGIVRPYSNAAWLETIKYSLDIARAMDIREVSLCTGRQSLELMQHAFPRRLPPAFVVAGDFIGAALALTRDFTSVSWGCFFGKLVKLARGCANTHAHVDELDMTFLASVADRPDLAQLPTARGALEILLRDSMQTINILVNMAKKQAENFAGRPVTIHLFHADGREMARA